MRVHHTEALYIGDTILHLSFVTQITEIKFCMDSYVKQVKRLKGGVLSKNFIHLSDFTELHI